jgi:SAM-dependent methyltransferase
MTIHEPEEIRRRVQEAYAAAARAGLDAPIGSNPLANSIYGDTTGGDDARAATSSLGCANPSALIALRPGQTVLDLGSGGGLDVLMTARRVGPSGRVIGVDMTPEMLALAETHRAAAGLDNVEFRQGHIEDLPVPDAAVDVVISNCVISLSADKARVLAEAHRVLRPGGRLAFTDLAAHSPLPPALAGSLAAWAGCIAGATLLDEWPGLLGAAGFVDVDVRVVRTFTHADLALLEATPLGSATLGDLTETDLSAADGQLVSVHVTATKPVAPASAPCCWAAARP